MTHDGLPVRERRLAVMVVAVGTTMGVLDSSIANVALPTISRELHASPSATVWVVNGFQIAVAATLFTFAALGDVIGYRRVYVGGIAFFTVGSLLCAFSHTLSGLVAARALQGFGASAIMCIVPALYRSIFPAAELGRGLGISALVVASSAFAGPTLGGAILAVLPWPWLFAINVPLGIIDTLIALRVLPDEQTRRGRLDVTSVLLSAPAMALLVLGLDGFAHPSAPAVIVVSLSAAAVLGFAFVRRQGSARRAMLPPDMWRVRRFSLASATSLSSYVAQGLAFVSLPFLLQGPLKYSPFASGLLMTPWPLCIAALGPIAGRLADRYQPALLCTIGLSLLSVGLALLALLPVHPSPFDIVSRGMVCGAGFGFFQSPNNREILGSVSRERSGSASGVLAAARVTGQTLGAAGVSIAFAVAGASLAGPGGSDAVLHAVTATFWVAATAATIAALTSASRLRALT